MDAEKITKVIEIYKRKFVDLNITQINFSHNDTPLRIPDVLGHTYGMLPQMEQFIVEKRIEKTFRWLGFVQGVLWCEGIYTLEELKEHNRP